MHIDVYQDIACPWCRIGKRHLARALEAWKGEPVTVTYRPFFLNQDIPPAGYNFRQYMTAKGGGNPDLERWFDAPRRAGAAVGLTFHFDRIEFAPNTLLAHRLAFIAPEAQRPAVIEGLYDAYFEFGEDIGNLETLVRVAARSGLNPESVRADLAGDAGREAVLSAAREAVELGVSSVPLFVFNHRFGVAGAQPAPALLNVMQRTTAAEENAVSITS
jgi:predicted DsbA family dithiol-disulfide isomerase